MKPSHRKTREWCTTKEIPVDWLGWDHKADKICRSKNKIINSETGKKIFKVPSYVQCPDCKGRFLPRLRDCGDGGCWHILVPPHKKVVKVKVKNPPKKA